MVYLLIHCSPINKYVKSHPSMCRCVREKDCKHKFTQITLALVENNIVVQNAAKAKERSL